MIMIALLNGTDPSDLGPIPSWLDEDDPRPAWEQLDENYHHGGGWWPNTKFQAIKKGSIVVQYPGNPPMYPIATWPFRDEMIVMYPHGYVAIFQRDGSFECARMD